MESSEVLEHEYHLEKIKQLCDYIRTGADQIVNNEDDRPDGIYDSEWQNHCRANLDKRFPLLSTDPFGLPVSINNLHIAMNALANSLDYINHPQAHEVIDLMRTAYSEMNLVRRQGLHYRVWCEEHVERYNHIKNMCTLLSNDPFHVLSCL